MSDPREWLAEYVDYVKLLAAEQLSAAMIAQRMNERFCTAFQRNAIIGKLRRLGVPLSGARSAEIGARLSDARRRAARARDNSVRNARRDRTRRGLNLADEAMAHRLKAELVPELPPNEFDNAIPPEQRRQLVDLKNCHCRWPVGDPREGGFFFCASPTADVIEGRPYCRAHTLRARGERRGPVSTWWPIGDVARKVVEAL